MAEAMVATQSDAEPAATRKILSPDERSLTVLQHLGRDLIVHSSQGSIQPNGFTRARGAENEPSLLFGGDGDADTTIPKHEDPTCRFAFGEQSSSSRVALEGLDGFERLLGFLR